MPSHVNYTLVCAQELTRFRPPYYVIPDPRVTYEDAPVTRQVLEAFLAALDGLSVCAIDDPGAGEQLQREIGDAARLALAASASTIRDVEVNHSRPTAEPGVWKQEPLRLQVHPVVGRPPSRVQIALAEDPVRIWRQATVLVHRVGTPCTPPKPDGLR